MLDGRGGGGVAPGPPGDREERIRPGAGRIKAEPVVAEGEDGNGPVELALQLVEADLRPHFGGRDDRPAARGVPDLPCDVDGPATVLHRASARRCPLRHAGGPAVHPHPHPQADKHAGRVLAGVGVSQHLGRPPRLVQVLLRQQAEHGGVGRTVESREPRVPLRGREVAVGRDQGVAQSLVVRLHRSPHGLAWEIFPEARRALVAAGDSPGQSPSSGRARAAPTDLDVGVHEGRVLRREASVRVRQRRPAGPDAARPAPVEQDAAEDHEDQDGAPRDRDAGGEARVERFPPLVDEPIDRRANLGVGEVLVARPRLVEVRFGDVSADIRAIIIGAGGTHGPAKRTLISNIGFFSFSSANEGGRSVSLLPFTSKRSRFVRSPKTSGSSVRRLSSARKSSMESRRPISVGNDASLFWPSRSSVREVSSPISVANTEIELWSWGHASAAPPAGHRAPGCLPSRAAEARPDCRSRTAVPLGRSCCPTSTKSGLNLPEARSPCTPRCTWRPGTSLPLATGELP